MDDQTVNVVCIWRRRGGKGAPLHCAALPCASPSWLGHSARWPGCRNARAVEHGASRPMKRRRPSPIIDVS